MCIRAAHELFDQDEQMLGVEGVVGNEGAEKNGEGSAAALVAVTV